MTIDEAIKHCLEVAEQNEKKAEYRPRMDSYDEIESRTDCLECAADHRQLAEWLTDYEGLRAEIIDLRLYVQMLEEYREKAKRLLKAAVEDIRYLINHAKRNGKACDRCKYGNEMYCYADDCSNDAKWQHEAEALALIGEDIDVPATEGDTNVGGKTDSWISCEDRLPNHYEEVLVVSKLENIVYFAWYDADISMFMGHSHMWATREVTHWQPLPEPPKDGDTNDTL